MAKNRISFGNLNKGKPGKDGKPSPNYVYMFRDVQLKKGEFVALETKKMRLESLAWAVGEGKISEDKAEKAREDIEKMAEYTLAELAVYRERESPSN